MKNDKMKYLLCFVFFTVLAVITFRCALPADYVFSASDLNIGRLAFIKHLLPEMFIGYYRNVELLGVSAHGFSLFNILLATLPLVFFANVFYGLILVAGSMSMVWFLRIWNRSWIASVVGALIAFWVNSILLAAAGHAYKVEVLALSVFALGLIEKSVRAGRIGRSIGFSVLAGLVVGIMMIEQQDVALLAGLFIGPYAVFRLVHVSGRAVLHWLEVLVPVGVVALLLSGSTMLRSYEQNVVKSSVASAPSADKWDFITQWSLVPGEWPDLIASGWGGWGSNDPKGPYWGRLGQSAEWPETGRGFRNFRITGNYIGIIPFLLGLAGFVAAIRNRKSEEGKFLMFWSIAGLVAFWLAFGKFSVLYKLFYHLPLLGNIRAPIKLLDNFQICLGIVSAYGLDQLLADGKGGKKAKLFWLSGLVFGGLMVLEGLKVLAFPVSWTAEFSRLGFAAHAETMVKNMSRAWLHGGMLALIFAALVFAVWKGWRQAKLVGGVFALVLGFDSLMLTSHYFRASDITALKNGNVVVNFIKDKQGNERTFLADTSGVYNQWLASDGPYHGLNLFNVWQMSRMPDDYKEFLGTVGRNQLRLWELTAVKYVAAPDSIMQQFSRNPELGKMFKPVLDYQIPTAQGMRKDVLLEFMNSIPRFALFHGWESVPSEHQCRVLASPQHNPRSTVLLDSSANLGNQMATVSYQPLEAKTTKRKATVRVVSEGQSVVRFSQYYQPGWTVYVDGNAADLLHVDYLCMGVVVPPGEHVVEFRCVSGILKAAFALVVFIVSVVTVVFLLFRSNKRSDG